MEKVPSTSDPLFVPPIPLSLMPAAFQDCRLCPRECRVDRMQGELGFCRTDAGLHVSSVCVHHGEEPVLAGDRGICNVFFSHCNLQCAFCQNEQISANQAYPPNELRQPEAVVQAIEDCLDRGIRHVGWVSPSHVLPHVVELLRRLRQRGRQVVSVYNTNAYDQVASLAALAGWVDVYLPDLKYADSRLAADWSQSPDYPATARGAIVEMFRQKGAACTFDEDGLMTSGLIIRHLVLPGQVENSLDCLRWIARELSPEVHVALMAQYTPTKRVAGREHLQRCLTEAEYDRVVEELDALGLENGWTQSLEAANHYCPDFTREHPFGG